MQSPIAAPREAYTAAQIADLIQDTPGLEVQAGCELLDLGLNVLDDVTDDLAGASVSRSSYATLHGTAQLAFQRRLDWGRAIVRPYMKLTNGLITPRFNLGAYYTSTSEWELSSTTTTWNAQGFDVLSILADRVGEVHSVESGTPVLTAVEQVLMERGVTQYVIDQSSAATVLPADRVWMFDENLTWLSVVNDLLAAIGYQGIYSDWDGRMRVQPYQLPSDRPAEWLYDTGLFTSLLAPERVASRDFFDVPNRWVVYWTNQLVGVPPVEGAGIYTYTNESVGDTSVEARGRTITRVIGVEAADQVSLVARAQSIIDADRSLPTKLKVATDPNPLHWHFDRAFLNDPDFGPPADVLCTQWTLPLDGARMTHEWTVI